VAAIVDTFISGFRKALDEGKVRVDSAADLDRLVRLRELINGNADSRNEIRGGITLEALQAWHRRLRGQVEAMTPELASATSQVAGEDDAQYGARHPRVGEAGRPRAGDAAATPKDAACANVRDSARPRAGGWVDRPFRRSRPAFQLSEPDEPVQVGRRVDAHLSSKMDCKRVETVTLSPFRERTTSAPARRPSVTEIRLYSAGYSAVDRELAMVTVLGRHGQMGHGRYGGAAVPYCPRHTTD
jgi:hypothetical protein